MKKDTPDFDKMTIRLNQNQNILVSECQANRGYSEEELSDYEAGLEVIFDIKLKEFYKKNGSVSIIWTVDRTKFQDIIPDEDLDFITGSIQILNPFEMIMGKTGTRWKNVLWFDNMEKNEKKIISSFVPFDFPNTEIQAGFKIVDKKISDKIFFLSNNEGLSPIQSTFHEYLENLIQTNGYNYWQTFLHDKSSTEYQRFIKYMPLLFSDFKLDLIK